MIYTKEITKSVLWFLMALVSFLCIMLAFALVVPVGILFLLFFIADKIYKKLEG